MAGVYTKKREAVFQPLLHLNMSPDLLKTVLHDFVILLVSLFVLSLLRAETIVDILEILCDIHLDTVVPAELECLLEWLESAKKRILKLNYKSLILCIVKLSSRLVLNLKSLVVIKNTCADETELIARVDLCTLVI